MYELRSQVQTLNKVPFAERFILLGREDIGLSVTTTDPEEPEWWVVGDSTPMNLYAKSQFSSADMAFSMHSGLMLRLYARDFEQSTEAPEEIGYDAFIWHASEDKDEVVRPLSLQSDGANSSFRFSVLSSEGQGITGGSAPPLSSAVMCK